MKTLFLLEMGMNDNSIPGDIKNYRVRVTENIDIVYKGEKFNMFFEFCGGNNRYNYRTTNKRTGKPLQKPVKEVINSNALWIDTEYERDEVGNGYTWKSSWRNSALEQEIHSTNPTFDRETILRIINKYSIEKYNKVVLVEEEARRIINKIGGYREKEILEENADFSKDGGSYIEKTNTWNNDHKIVRVNRQTWEPTENGRKLVVKSSCEVDILNGKITG